MTRKNGIKGLFLTKINLLKYFAVHVPNLFLYFKFDKQLPFILFFFKFAEYFPAASIGPDLFEYSNRKKYRLLSSYLNLF